jgi:hypothetical protein
MKRIYFGIICVGLLLAANATLFAQESEMKVVDEVVAVVNEDVITLSAIRRESKQIVDANVMEGKTREDAQKEIDEKQGELIANLINQELLEQKAAELGLDKEADASVNRRLVQIMQQYGLKTTDELYEEMRKQGVDPTTVRANWKSQEVKNLVISQEVQSKIYWGLTEKELKEYFEAHKDKFMPPETVSISEMFLSFAGRDQESVRKRAAEIVAELRGGADFEKLLMENSDRTDKAETKGKVDDIELAKADQQLQAALKGLKPGEYADPYEVKDVGMSVIRLDGRKAAGTAAQYDENAVRLAIMNERFPDALKKYMTDLRSDSYIKINENYRASVAPILYEDERSQPQKDEQ